MAGVGTTVTVRVVAVVALLTFDRFADTVTAAMAADAR
jgi:hypothetical protein